MVISTEHVKFTTMFCSQSALIRIKHCKKSVHNETYYISLLGF